LQEIPLDAVREVANADPEFRIAARFWNADVRFAVEAHGRVLRVRAGRIEAVLDDRDAPACDVSIGAPAETWREILAPVPRPFYQDLYGASLQHDLRFEGDLDAFYPYYPAVRRLVELLRAAR
jgi:hypothetical protein